LLVSERLELASGASLASFQLFSMSAFQRFSFWLVMLFSFSAFARAGFSVWSVMRFSFCFAVPQKSTMPLTASRDDCEPGFANRPQPAKLNHD